MSDDQSGFDTFWGAYPRRTGKGAARKAWAAAIKREDGLAILHCLYAQIDAGMFDKESQFIPHPRTWLCQDRWSDDIVQRKRPAFRNGALELLAQEHEAGAFIEADVAQIEGPAHAR